MREREPPRSARLRGTGAQACELTRWRICRAQQRLRAQRARTRSEALLALGLSAGAPQDAATQPAAEQGYASEEREAEWQGPSRVLAA